MIWNMFQVFRPANLLIIFFTQSLFYFLLIKPVFDRFQIDLKFDNAYFLLLCFTTLLITAAGNVINDYFDYDADREKKEKFQFANRKVYLQLYVFLLISGFLIAVPIAAHIDQLVWLSFYLIASLVLFLYSFKLKSTILTGNILVALFTAGVILILPVAEFQALDHLKERSYDDFKFLLSLLFFFSALSFVANLIREMVKDLVDRSQDKAFGVVTVATQFSQYVNKLVIGSLSIFLIGLNVVWIIFFGFKPNVILVLSILMILIPSLLVFILVVKSSSTQHFSYLSKALKAYMFLALFYILIYSWY